MIDKLPQRFLQSLSTSLVLDCSSGKLCRVLLNQSYLLQFLWNAKLDSEKMATLHCVLSCGRDEQLQEDKVGLWPLASVENLARNWVESYTE